MEIQDVVCRQLKFHKPTLRMDNVNVMPDMFGHKLGVVSEKPMA